MKDYTNRLNKRIRFFSALTLEELEPMIAEFINSGDPEHDIIQPQFQYSTASYTNEQGKLGIVYSVMVEYFFQLPLTYGE